MPSHDLLPLIDLGDDANSVGRPADYLMARTDVAMLTAGLGEALRAGSALPAELVELVGLVVAVRRRSQFGIVMHRRLAAAAGIDPALTNGLVAGAIPPVTDRGQAMTIEIVDTLLSAGRISASVYNEARTRLGDAALADLVALVGYHTMMAMTINAYRP